MLAGNARLSSSAHKDDDPQITECKMTEIETPDTAPEAKQPQPSGKRRWSKRYLVGTLLVGLGTAAGVGFGANTVQAHLWRGFDNAKNMTTEEISSHVDRRVERILSRINGTAEQQKQISTIAKAAIGDLKAMEFAPQEIRGKVIELLSADTFDPAALETLRAEHVAKFDAASKRIAQAVSDAANVLTVEQRKQLVQRMSERGWHGGWRGGHHGSRGHHGGFWDWR